MKQTFYKAIDGISGSLESGVFGMVWKGLHSDLDAVKHTQKFIILTANNFRSNKDDIAQRLQHFKSLVCFDVLAEELEDRYIHINKKSTKPLKKVTKISTVWKVLNKK